MHYSENTSLEKSQSGDMARNTFVAKLPHWLRWLLFFPSALIGSLLVPMLWNSYLLSRGINPTSPFFAILLSGLFGALFVGIGSFIAPRKQREVALALAIFMFVFQFIALATDDDRSLSFLSANIASILGSLVTAFVIYVEEIKKI